MPRITDYELATSVADTDVLFMIRDPEGSPTSRQVTRGTFLGDTLQELANDGTGHFARKDASNVFTLSPNSFQSENGCTVNILAKGAAGAQNDAASLQLQKTNDASNERFIFTRYFGHSSRSSETWLDNRIGGAVSAALVIGNGFVNVGSAEFRVGNGKVIDADRVVFFRSYTVATVPSASTKGAGSAIYVSNGAAGSPVLAYSNGTNWLRVDTRATITSS